MNGWLKQLIRTKTVTFSTLDEEAGEYLVSAMEDAEEEYKKKKTSPVFRTGKDAVSWLEKQGI